MAGCSGWLRLGAAEAVTPMWTVMLDRRRGLSLQHSSTHEFIEWCSDCCWLLLRDIKAMLSATSPAGNCNEAVAR